MKVSQPEIYHTHPLQIDTALMKDMNNEQVQTAQQMLNSLGFAPGREDGYFDEATEKAVMAFQNQRSSLPAEELINKQLQL